MGRGGAVVESDVGRGVDEEVGGRLVLDGDEDEDAPGVEVDDVVRVVLGILVVGGDGSGLTVVSVEEIEGEELRGVTVEDVDDDVPGSDEVVVDIFEDVKAGFEVEGVITRGDEVTEFAGDIVV
ncbi:hypothetical protein ACEPPN_005394 [Leptodophora sp. 'Broadleaf-Isolate-01']